MENCIYGTGLATADNRKYNCIINTPTPRRDYGATLLPHYVLFIRPVKNFIRGNTGDMVSYDINLIVNKGVTLRTFSVIYPDGYLDNTLNYVLDLNNYNWYIPKASGKIPRPRAFQQIIIYGQQFLIRKFRPSPPSSLPSSPLSTLPSSSSSLSPSLSPSSPLSPPNNSGNIAIAVVGSLLSSILLSVGSFLIVYSKWNKNEQKQKTIYENENDNDYSREEKELPIIRNIHNYEREINNDE
ncbi:hypothetical protein RhiirC2_794971 [Rhizophagus irregularis]|uniref:Uncharacterized protein n=1 Tax=Rhizophagus irregularis TaxID=588596 RepID=A0A2N1MCH2_9GLOM|nr:hypothetical protein RhiirC2_794971 [Rhizophagus irregularis]